MANVEKLSYLKLSLKSDSVQIFPLMLVTDTIYDIAKRKLEERYNNERSIVNAHLAGIHFLPAIKKESKVELRKILEPTNEHVQALKALRLPVDQWDVILVYWLLEKLDAESREQFVLTLHGTDVITCKQLTTSKDSLESLAAHRKPVVTSMMFIPSGRLPRRFIKKPTQQRLSTQRVVR